MYLTFDHVCALTANFSCGPNSLTWRVPATIMRFCQVNQVTGYKDESLVDEEMKDWSIELIFDGGT